MNDHVKKKPKQHSFEVPDIPLKKYFTIGEVAKFAAVKPYVLRYWEKEFPMLEPMKRRGNRRNYVKEDIALIFQIKSLLYVERYTIDGARAKLEADQKAKRSGKAAPVLAAVPVTKAEPLSDMLQNLERALDLYEEA